MSQREQSLLKGSTIVATAAGIGFCFVVSKYRIPIFKQIKMIANYKDPLRNQEIRIIDTLEECRTLMRNLKTYVLIIITVCHYLFHFIRI